MQASSSANSPYGTKTDGNSGIIALGKGWAYYMGSHLTDQRYGSLCGEVGENQSKYRNNSPLLNLSSQLNALEGFNPSLTIDPFYWIPQGLFYDLKDTRNETILTGGSVDDAVSNYSNSQMFNAFGSSITTLQGYRNNLLLLNSNNQATQINTLLSSYGY